MTFLVCYSVAPVLVAAAHDALGGYGPPFGALACLGCVELAIATRFGPGLRGVIA